MIVRFWVEPNNHKKHDGWSFLFFFNNDWSFPKKQVVLILVLEFYDLLAKDLLETS